MTMALESASIFSCNDLCQVSPQSNISLEVYQSVRRETQLKLKALNVLHRLVIGILLLTFGMFMCRPLIEDLHASFSTPRGGY